MRKTLLTTASLGALLALLPAYASAQNSTVFVDGNVVNNAGVFDPVSDRLNEIDDDSYDDSDGIHQAQQNNGSLNAIQIGTDVMVNIAVGGGNINSEVVVSGELDNNYVEQGPATGAEFFDRENEIESSFDRADGLYSVQQNNGDVNVMGIGNSVVAAVEDDDVGTVRQDVAITGPDPNNPLGSSWISENPARTVAFDYGDVTRYNSIDGSFDDFSGVASVQQNNGGYNLMGIGNSIVGIDGATVDRLVQNVSSAGQMIVGPNGDGQLDGLRTADYGSWRINTIEDSFQGASGMLSIQQNNGNANALSIANAVAGTAYNLGGVSNVIQNVTSGGSVTDAQTYNSFDYYLRRNPYRNNTIIDGTAEEAEGILNVQQNNGDVNSISQSTAVAAATDQVGNVTQNVVAAGTVSNFDDQSEYFVDMNSTRLNIIDESFEGFDGIANVQQNNGDSNVMASSIAVVGVLDNRRDNNIGDFGTTRQNVSTDGLVQDVESSVDWQSRQNGSGERTNEITDSFEYGFDGIASVQQNNGNANVILSAIAVQAAYQTDIDGDLEPIRQSVSATGEVDTLNQSDDDWFESRGSDRDNLIADSFESNRRWEDGGIVSIQQNNGDGNVMGSSIGVFVSYDSEDIDGQSRLLTTTLGDVHDNDLANWYDPGIAGDLGSDRDNDIEDDSFDHFGGVASIQQNNGNGNVLGSAMAINASLNPAQGAVDGGLRINTDATGYVTNNQIRVSPYSERDNDIENSFDHFQGVASVQQNNGDINVMGSAVSVAVHEDNGGPGFGPVVSTTTLAGTVSGNTVSVDCGCSGPSFSNEIDNSFNNASGISSVQQNNGSANVIGSAISVTVNGNLNNL
ncbi:MAG: hypothetical protein RLO50_19580 [Azospirillaceae bacterium]